MTRRSLLAFTFTALALGAVGCGPPWQVIVQSVPDPFFGQGEFVVTPIDFSGLQVGGKSEADYLSEKDEKQRASFAEDKAGINERFTSALLDRAQSAGIQVELATGPQDGPFVIRPSVRFLEGGFFTGFVNSNSKVEMNVKITMPDGKILDEIVIGHSSPATMTNPSSGGRLRDDGYALGSLVARYIKSRVGAQ